MQSLGAKHIRRSRSETRELFADTQFANSPQKNKERITLTTRKNHPNEIHEKVIKPKIQKLRPAVRHPRIIMIKHARRIIKYQTVDLAHADDDLERVPERVRFDDQEREQETDWAPGELLPSDSVSLWGSKGEGWETYGSYSFHAENEGVGG